MSLNHAGALLLLALATAQASARSPPAGSPEARVKSEFVERFTRFVEWPPAALAPGRATFVVCVAGHGPVIDELARIVETRPWKSRPARLRQVTPDDVAGCHLLFIPETAAGDLDRLLAGTRRRPVLTVGDGPGFAQRGVLINLVRAGTRVAFEINVAAVEESGLQVSSRLLQLGRIVGRA